MSNDYSIYRVTLNITPGTSILHIIIDRLRTPSVFSVFVSRPVSLTNTASVFRRIQNCKKRLLASSCPSGRPYGTGTIFLKFDISVFFEKLSRRVKFHSNRIRIMGTLHEDN